MNRSRRKERKGYHWNGFECVKKKLDSQIKCLNNKIKSRKNTHNECERNSHWINRYKKVVEFVFGCHWTGYSFICGCVSTFQALCSRPMMHTAYSEYILEFMSFSWSIWYFNRGINHINTVKYKNKIVIHPTKFH